MSNPCPCVCLKADGSPLKPRCISRCCTADAGYYKQVWPILANAITGEARNIFISQNPFFARDAVATVVPNATFDVGGTVTEVTCMFLTASIVINHMGSSFAPMIAAFDGHPLLVEDVRKEVGLLGCGPSFRGSTPCTPHTRAGSVPD